jgi:hypothetical protein
MFQSFELREKEKKKLVRREMNSSKGCAAKKKEGGIYLEVVGLLCCHPGQLVIPSFQS